MNQPFESLSPRPRRLRSTPRSDDTEPLPMVCVSTPRHADCSTATGWTSACTGPLNGQHECEWKPGEDSRSLGTHPARPLDYTWPSHGRRTRSTSRTRAARTARDGWQVALAAAMGRRARATESSRSAPPRESASACSRSRSGACRRTGPRPFPVAG